MVEWFRANYRPAEEYLDVGVDCRDVLMDEFHQDLETRFGAAKGKPASIIDHVAQIIGQMIADEAHRLHGDQDEVVY
jgi:hypothetical protein